MNFKRLSFLSKFLILSRKKNSIRIFENLKNDNHSLSYNEIKNRQFLKIKNILWHAYDTVPYYKKLFIENKIVSFGELNINQFSDIQKIPILTKDVLKSNFDDFISSKFKNDKTIFINRSGGSTGEPARVLQNKIFTDHAEANYYYSKHLRGITPYDRILKLWGAQRDIKKTLFLRDYITNKFIFNSFNLDDDRIKIFIDLIDKLKPDILEAYSSSLFEVAKFMNENKTYVNHPIKLHTSASNLFPHMRNEIENAFRYKVFDHYGGREVSSIATQCKYHNGYHILMDHNFVEIKNENGDVNIPNEEGDVIITNLNNYVMPLIRYNFGDRATFLGNDRCNCGCKYDKLLSVNGRQEETVFTKSGKRITGIFFIQHIGVYVGFQEIEQFQIVQISLDELELRIKLNKNDKLSREQELKIIESILDVIGESMTIRIEYVDYIEKTSTGKHRYIISKL